MQRIMLKSKIHRATVTSADLHYEGSLSIDKNLLEAANILPYEKIDVWNVTNGERFSTYAIEGARGSGVISTNGAAAHKAKKGDIVIIATFAMIEENKINTHKPSLIYMDENNRQKNLTALAG